MAVGNISFGNVIAVSGKYNKVEKLNRKLRNQTHSGNLMMKDVTKQYIHASSWGVLAQAAQKGDRVEIYITGKDDVDKVKNKTPKWDTIDGILSHLSSYHNLNRLSVGELVNRIINNK